MAEPRRRRASTEEKLTRLLDATEEIILEEGYAAVSSRNVAARAGMQAPLLHYYFPTIDELFVAVLRRRSEPNVERMKAAMGSPEPFKAWWELASDPRGTALLLEFVAAANHRPALKAEVGKAAYQVRRMQMQTLEAILPEYGLDSEDFPPAFIAAAMQGIAFAIVADEAAGFDTAHEEARAGMDRLVGLLEKRRTKRRGAR
jgi:AcrR family transcriptional regulator